jgi:hypothetical protein
MQKARWVIWLTGVRCKPGGPVNTKDTYLILEAKGRASSLTLRNEDGRQQVVRPGHDVERPSRPKR